METVNEESPSSLFDFFILSSTWDINQLENIIKTGVDLNKPIPQDIDAYETEEADSFYYVEHDPAPLHVAAERGDNAVVQMLLDHGALVDILDKEKATPLHGAAEAGNHETVELLLSRGAVVSARDHEGNTPLHKTKSKKVAEILLRNGASVLEKNNHSQSVLHCVHKQSLHANYFGSLREITELYIDDGFEVDGEDKSGRSALNYAAGSSDAEALLVLIRKGAKVNRQDKHGWTPLYWALYSSTVGPENVEVLVNHGASLEIRDVADNTPMHMTTSCAKAVILLRKGVRLDVQNKQGWTALHRAACFGESELVAQLLAYGFSANVKDTEGNIAYNLTGPRSEKKRLIATHMHLSVLAGLPVCEDVEVDNPLRKKKTAKAVRELERIKATNISERLCLHDIIGQFQRPSYLLYDGVIEEIELFFQSPDFRNRYPLYTDILKATFIQSKNSRYYLTRRATRSMMSETRKKCCQLTPDLVWEQVFEFLDLDDISNIIHSEL